MTTTVLAYIPSPAQGVWQLGPVPLRAYALFIVAGIIAALVIGDRRWAARGGEPGVIYDVALWAVPFGLIGGRVYHVMTDWRTYFGDDGAGLLAAFRIWDGGLGIWGAVALGGVGAWIACRRHGIPLPAFGDAIAPGIVLAQAIGRLGNYFNQELYGRPTTLPWGLEIYERRNAGGALDSLNGVSTGQLVDVVHPTFLYELLWNLVVFAALILIDRRFRIGHGRLFAMYVAGYCLGRFWIELMRSDTATLLAGIRINAFTATFVFVGAVVYIMSAPKGREDPATLQRKPVDGADDDDSVAEDLAKVLTVAASGTGVVAAAKVASEDDEKSVAEAAEAEAFSADVEAEAEEPEPDSAAEDLESVGPEAVSENEAEADELDGLDTDAGGPGSVEGDETADAGGDASVVHDDAIEEESAAAELAADVESDPQVAEPDVDGAEAVAGDEPAEAVEDESVVHDDGAEGRGSVEGGEVAEAGGDAPEVDEAGVEVESEAEGPDSGDEAAGVVEVDEGVEVVSVEESAADGVGDESDEPATEAGGLGAVDGDEVAEAIEDAPIVHEVAVDDQAAAEELAAQVQDEPEVSEAGADAAEGPDSGDEAAGVVEVDEGVEVVSVEESAADGVGDESDEPVIEAGGLGAVDGDEVAEAIEDAPIVHEVAVDDQAAAEELAAQIDNEASDESETEAETGVAEAQDVPEVAVDGASAADTLPAEVESDPEVSKLERAGEPNESDNSRADDDSADSQELAVEGASAADILTAEVGPEPDESESASAGDNPTTDSDQAVAPDPDTKPESREALASTEPVANVGNSESGSRIRRWLLRRRSR